MTFVWPAAEAKTSLRAVALKSLAGALLLGGLLAAFSTSAQATLIGQTVGCSVSSDSASTNFNCSSETAVVQSPGEEFTIVGVRQVVPGITVENPFFIFDIGESSILIEPITNGFLAIGSRLDVALSDLFWLGNPDAVITGFLLSVADVTGFDEADISFSDNAIGFELGGGTGWSAGSSATITLLTEDRPVLTVPEPATLALFGLGLAGLGVVGRRKAKATQPPAAR